MVYSLGYQAGVPQALIWQTSNGLTYPVLADASGAVVLAYTNLFGSPLLPWDAIVGVDRVVAFTGDSYSGGIWNQSGIDSIFNALFEPVAAANPTALDFGPVSEGTSADLTVTLDNAGTGAVVILDTYTNTAAFIVPNIEDTIYAVDDSLVITVTFAPPQWGPFWDTLTVVTPEGNLEIPLYGECPDFIAPGQGMPRAYEVSCHPNPFNAQLNVSLSLPYAQEVSLDLYAVDGSLSQRLYRGDLPAGLTAFRWEAAAWPSGLYLLQITGETWQRVEKIVLIR